MVLSKQRSANRGGASGGGRVRSLAQAARVAIVVTVMPMLTKGIYQEDPPPGQEHDCVCTRRQHTTVYVRNAKHHAYAWLALGEHVCTRYKTATMHALTCMANCLHIRLARICVRGCPAVDSLAQSRVIRLYGRSHACSESACMP